MQIRFRISLAVCMRSGASQQASAHASLPYVFAPGSYVVEVMRDDGPVWQWPFETVRWRNGATIGVPEPRKR